MTILIYECVDLIVFFALFRSSHFSGSVATTVVERITVLTYVVLVCMETVSAFELVRNECKKHNTTSLILYIYIYICSTVPTSPPENNSASGSLCWIMSLNLCRWYLCYLFALQETTER